jgi:hypothetical protein
MNRILQYDQIDLAPAKITQRDDPLFGITTVFHDVVIAREIVHKYEDGWAYKPARELRDAAWTAEGRWVVVGGHPDTAVVSSRNDISGRTVNVRYTKSLMDPKTNRPNNHGILADLEVFDSRVSPDTLNEMKSGTRRDVSIGFFFDQDAVSGVIEGDKHPLKGTAYDYVQRNIMIDHTAAALDTGSGRCSMPYCGIGSDSLIYVTGDPVGPWETFGQCVAAIMKKNPDYTREQAEGTCGKIYKQTKEKDFISTDDDNLSMSKQEAIDKFIEALDAFKQLFVTEDEAGTDDLVEEEYQGNAESITESQRAMLFFNIPQDMWDALSEMEKEDYIGRLPPKKTRAGGEELSDRDCVYPWEDIREKILGADTIEPVILSQILKEMTFDGESVTITEETKGKLSELGVDLNPCDGELDEGETGEEEESEDNLELESEDIEEALPSTEEVLQKAKKVLEDLERIVG